MKPKPLPAKPFLRRGPAPARDWAATASILRANPGIWYEVAHYDTDTNEAWRIKTGANPAFREGRWDAMRETTDDGYVIYACCLSPE